MDPVPMVAQIVQVRSAYALCQKKTKTLWIVTLRNGSFLRLSVNLLKRKKNINQATQIFVDCVTGCEPLNTTCSYDCNRQYGNVEKSWKKVNL